MMSLTTATEHARGMLEKGELPDIAAANVAIVRMMGVRLIDSRVPREARAALQAGVRSGQLGHLAKKGLEPEAFFHPNAKAHAKDLRAREARKAIDALKVVIAPAS